jgi:hypothetical protein
MPFIKGIILNEIDDEVEIYKYIAKDLEFKSEVNENFLNGLRSGMSELYTYFKSQLRKLGDCQNF